MWLFVTNVARSALACAAMRRSRGPIEITVLLGSWLLPDSAKVTNNAAKVTNNAAKVTNNAAKAMNNAVKAMNNAVR